MLRWTPVCAPPKRCVGCRGSWCGARRGLLVPAAGRTVQQSCGPSPHPPLLPPGTYFVLQEAAGLLGECGFVAWPGVEVEEVEVTDDDEEEEGEGSGEEEHGSDSESESIESAEEHSEEQEEAVEAEAPRKAAVRGGGRQRSSGKRGRSA